MYVCFVGVGNGAKLEGMIIKNVNWLKKNPMFFYFFYPPPPLRHGSTYQHGGVYELRPHRERNQTFLNAERLARKLA